MIVLASHMLQLLLTLHPYNQCDVMSQSKVLIQLIWYMVNSIGPLNSCYYTVFPENKSHFWPPNSLAIFEMRLVYTPKVRKRGRGHFARTYAVCSCMPWVCIEFCYATGGQIITRRLHSSNIVVFYCRMWVYAVAFTCGPQCRASAFVRGATYTPVRLIFRKIR